MRLKAKHAHWASANNGGIMLVNAAGNNCGVFDLQVAADHEYSRKLIDALIEHINATEFDVELPPRMT